MTEMQKTEVLVVGAGPAGLSIALELGQQGRHCVVIEAQDRGGMAPRAKTTNVRTRELMRRWGVADALAALSPFGLDYASDVVFATALTGFELARFRNGMYCSPVRDDRFSAHGQWIPQYRVEQVLREAALALPTVSLRQPVRLVSFVQDEAGVLATLEDGNGQRSLLRARYLVGADGARSTVREQLGIAMEGVSPLGHHRNHVFRSPGLAQRHALGQAAMYWLVNEHVPCVMAPLEQGDRWTFGGPRDALTGDPAALIRTAIGVDVPVEILSVDDWTAHQLIARRYRGGSAFLIGDACHLHPPYGGHGMNMGVGDAVDLGWKLAAVLAGWAAPALLDTYEAERSQVHRRVVDESTANHRLLPRDLCRPGLTDTGPAGEQARREVGERILAGKRQEFDSLGLVIGYHYEESPALLREPEDAAPRQPRGAYEACARPGCLAPHAWLAPGQSAGASLYDHFDRRGFTLLATAADAPADAPTDVHTTAARLGVPWRYTAPRHPGLEALYGAAYALIRPDQHVAWRGNDPARAAEALRVACAR